MSDFRNYRLGPTISCIGNVQTGLMYSIVFSRHGDVTLSILKAMLKSTIIADKPGFKDNLRLF